MPAESNQQPQGLQVGYVVKMYPRLSETFIVDEIRGVEAAGVEVSIFSLRSPSDGRFHRDLSQVRATAHYLPGFGSHSALVAMEIIAELGIEPAVVADALGFLRGLLPDRQIGVLTQALHLSRAVHKHRLHHLHAHFMTIAAHTAYLAHLFTGVPFTVTAHAKDVFRHGVDIDIFRTVAEAARAVVTVCDVNKSYIEDNILDGAGRVERVYNGVFLDEPAPAVEPDPRLILAVGRLVEKKGFDRLIRACHLLRQRGVGFQCVLVGDGEETDALAGLVDSLGLRAGVHMAGALPRHQVMALMNRARVIAAPCLEGEDGNRDALPTVLLEALAVGLPIVSTRLGGIPEIVDDGVHGLLVDPGDEVGLADALQDLLTDDELWMRCRLAGRPRAAARFDRSRTAIDLASNFFPATPVGTG